MAMTKYLVFKHHAVGSAGDEWVLVFDSEAHTAEDSMRAATKAGKLVHGDRVMAVPERNCRTKTVKVDTTTRISLT